MPTILEKLLLASAGAISERIAFHQVTPQVSLSSHIRSTRAELARRVASKQIIYLDSNAWKCLADFANNKPRLTSEMQYFAKAIERCRLSGNFAFPIGLPTFFEMDAMTNPETHEAFVRMVDGLSHGCCTTPFPERIGLEVTRLIKGDLSEMKDPADFVVSPIELLGIPVLSFGLTELKDVDEATFNKAFYDVISRLPFSAQLQIAKQHDSAKWNNTRGTAELNRGKLEHQTEIANLNTGILIELRGIISAWREAEHVELSDNTINAISINALYHWHQNPTSKAFPTIRILSAIYGLMRFDSSRRYKDGDTADFQAAAGSLPMAHALFTDRRLANILAEKEIGLSAFVDCSVVSGFGEMTEFLNGKLDTPRSTM